VHVVAVNVDREAAAARAFLAKARRELDPLAISLGRYRVMGMPTTFLVDRHGTVKLTRVGFNVETGLEELEQAVFRFGIQSFEASIDESGRARSGVHHVPATHVSWHAARDA